jgi:DNA-binding CsgD family transcriptional regulator
MINSGSVIFPEACLRLGHALDEPVKLYTVSTTRTIRLPRSRLRRRSPAPAARVEPQGGLTHRQLEIARLVADGLSNRQIAARLFLSGRTVETHITNILNRLGLGSRVQLSRWMADTAASGTTGLGERHQPSRTRRSGVTCSRTGFP